MLIHNTALTMRGKRPNWLLGVLIPTTYILGGVIIDAKSSVVAPSSLSATISDAERAKIAEEAIAQYKAEQEAIEAERNAKIAEEVKAVKSMKKADLITKAMGMGIVADDSDDVPELREKIIKALSE